MAESVLKFCNIYFSPKQFAQSKAGVPLAWKGLQKMENKIKEAFLKKGYTEGRGTSSGY